jgi:hypothetical protein
MTPSDNNNSDKQTLKTLIRLIAEVKQEDPLTISREMLKRSEEMMAKNNQPKPDQS